jgi:hypothetical protein
MIGLKNIQIFYKYILFFVFIFFVVFSFNQVFADMSGGGYKIDSDSINSGGNDYSVSGDIQISDTVGEIAIGDSDSTGYAISAGYRNMDETSVSISVSLQDITLSPDLGGLTGGTSTGATQVTVVTDNPAGYQLSVQAETSPALRSDEDTIADYESLVVDTPDYQYRLVPAQSVFGFTPEGDDIIDRYRDDGGSICGVIGGYDTPNHCWEGLNSSGKTISNRSVPTDHLGSATTIRFSAGIGVGRLQKMGTYLATTTITALAL